ncbi:hypothetical protein C173_23082 [Paenibacillus sp. FSL R7-277]|nr:hypothetical protein C173_23082 [Paenibacillus sp. FSL R7-277]
MAWMTVLLLTGSVISNRFHFDASSACREAPILTTKSIICAAMTAFNTECSTPTNETRASSSAMPREDLMLFCSE